MTRRRSPRQCPSSAAEPLRDALGGPGRLLTTSSHYSLLTAHNSLTLATRYQAEGALKIIDFGLAWQFAPLAAEGEGTLTARACGRLRRQAGLPGRRPRGGGAAAVAAAAAAPVAAEAEAEGASPLTTPDRQRLHSAVPADVILRRWSAVSEGGGGGRVSGEADGAAEGGGGGGGGEGGEGDGGEGGGSGGGGGGGGGGVCNGYDVVTLHAVCGSRAYCAPEVLRARWQENTGPWPLTLTLTSTLTNPKPNPSPNPIIPILSSSPEPAPESEPEPEP